jgi:hypothetical protein
MHLRRVIQMKELKRIAKVGERIKVISDYEWERSGLWKNPHPIGSEWIVEKVTLKNCFPPGLIDVKGSEYGIGFGSYVVIEYEENPQ